MYPIIAQFGYFVLIWVLRNQRSPTNEECFCRTVGYLEHLAFYDERRLDDLRKEMHLEFCGEPLRKVQMDVLNGGFHEPQCS